MQKRGRKETVGEAIEELQKMRNRAKTESAKFQEKYIVETVKEAQSTVKRLQELLDTLKSKETDDEALTLVDKMYSVLMESHRDLVKTENDFDFWHNLNLKFEN